ncbi:hypothetical protein XI08_42090 [Bradyrhizobium sp. CCBAU 11361]|nr:hypothetical protein [Bradyrhizobium sp. CCBAU 11361]
MRQVSARGDSMIEESRCFDIRGSAGSPAPGYDGSLEQLFPNLPKRGVINDHLGVFIEAVRMYSQ